jgi:hypothetical protein
MRKTMGDNSSLSIQDLGDARRLLGNRQYFQKKARDLISRGVVSNEAAVGGWLGKYEAALMQATKNLHDESGRRQDEEKKVPRRGR